MDLAAEIGLTPEALYRTLAELENERARSAGLAPAIALQKARRCMIQIIWARPALA